MTKLTTDITYLTFGMDILYLSSILDSLNNKIIAYKISDYPNENLVINTLNQLHELLGHKNTAITMRANELSQ
ncbi:hypothetical protein [Companilactobacillus keshanensis]|uniref:Integrase catalytic domain-containing protein n=1 Tax=Companilactobacillus keshanensis TaxID=2486003 RepID=A0ABW4BV58_9LACO|nr:hypothetical protein [Companilactobacillus keshanensis]